MKKAFFVFIAAVVLLSGCARQADVASSNISTAADNFEVYRRVVFYNGITDKYILSVEGLCSLGNYDANRELSVTCKVGDGRYVKHFLGLSDNVTYFAEQMKTVPADPFQYRVIFNPASIIPDAEVITP